MYSMPHMAILPAAVRSNEQRNMIISLGAGVCATVFTTGNTFTANITGFFNNIGFKNGYVPFMLMCGVFAFISFWGLFATSKGKEKYLVEPEKGHPLKEMCIRDRIIR